MNPHYHFGTGWPIERRDVRQFARIPWTAVVGVDTETEERVLRAILQWAGNHPTSDRKAIHVGSAVYSPGEIAREVRDRTSAGMLILKIVENSLQEHSVEEVLRAFEASSTAHKV